MGFQREKGSTLSEVANEHKLLLHIISPPMGLISLSLRDHFFTISLHNFSSVVRKRRYAGLSGGFSSSGTGVAGASVAVTAFFSSSTDAVAAAAVDVAAAGAPELAAGCASSSLIDAEEDACCAAAPPALLGVACAALGRTTAEESAAIPRPAPLRVNGSQH